jgi:hypothetical protein
MPCSQGKRKSEKAKVGGSQPLKWFPPDFGFSPFPFCLIFVVIFFQVTPQSGAQDSA